MPLGPPPLLSLQLVFSWGVELTLYENLIGFNPFPDGKATFQY